MPPVSGHEQYHLPVAQTLCAVGIMKAHLAHNVASTGLFFNSLSWNPAIFYLYACPLARVLCCFPGLAKGALSGAVSSKKRYGHPFNIAFKIDI